MTSRHAYDNDNEKELPRSDSKQRSHPYDEDFAGTDHANSRLDDWLKWCRARDKDWDRIEEWEKKRRVRHKDTDDAFPLTPPFPISQSH